MAGVEVYNNLECKMCVNTYKMYFVTKSEDFLRRRRVVSKVRRFEPI